MIIEIKRYGKRGNIPLSETSVWTAAKKDTKDARAVYIKDFPDNLWVLTSITDALVEVKKFQTVADSNGVYFVPPESPFWAPLNLPLREGVELIDEAEYNKLCSVVFASCPPVRDIIARKSFEMRA